MQIELHILQSFPPANLNRDENGMPKSCVFGGRNRARISSQCQKRAVRLHYQEFAGLGNEVLAYRSKNLATKIANLLEEEGIVKNQAELAAQCAITVFTVKDEKLKGKAKTKKKTLKNETNKVEDEQEFGKSDTGLFLGAIEIKSIVSYLKQNWQQVEIDIQAEEPSLSKVIVDFIKKTVGEKAKPGDVALFGRMMASLPSGNVDAAVQVAHAIGVNALEQEFDFFTAVDDLSASDDQGADHMGETGYNSSTYYRFAVLDTKQLINNLGNSENAPAIAHAFAEGFVKAIPSGHQNSFAAHSLPAAVIAVVRSGQPVSLVDAFEDPIRPSNGLSLLAKSLKALDTHWQDLQDMYGSQGVSYVGIVTRNRLQEHVGSLKDKKVASLEVLITEAIASAFNVGGQ